MTTVRMAITRDEARKVVDAGSAVAVLREHHPHFADHESIDVLAASVKAYEVGWARGRMRLRLEFRESPAWGRRP